MCGSSTGPRGCECRWLTAREPIIPIVFTDTVGCSALRQRRLSQRKTTRFGNFGQSREASIGWAVPATKKFIMPD